MNCRNLRQEYSYVPSEVLNDKEKAVTPFKDFITLLMNKIIFLTYSFVAENSS